MIGYGSLNCFTTIRSTGSTPIDQWCFWSEARNKVAKEKEKDCQQSKLQTLGFWMSNTAEFMFPLLQYGVGSPSIEVFWRKNKLVLCYIHVILCKWTYAFCNNQFPIILAGEKKDSRNSIRILQTSHVSSDQSPSYTELASYICLILFNFMWWFQRFFIFTPKSWGNVRKWSNLTTYFPMDWNHQVELIPIYFTKIDLKIPSLEPGVTRGVSAKKNRFFWGRS